MYPLHLPDLPISEPVLIVAIAAAIFLLAPLLLERLGLPGIVGIIVAGAVVGPNALNLLARSETIVLLGTVGLLYLMFMAGVQIDLHGFRRHRRQSILFGALTFLLPQVLGTAVMLLLGYGWAASILIASMFASHTLLAYPIAVRFGISKNRAVNAGVGGTIITDTAALLVLAVVAAATEGVLDAPFWLRLVTLLGAYLALVAYGLPPLARWFFRHQKAPGSDYLFVLAVLFGGSFLAEMAGVEPIVGAFVIGLGLNRLIPEGTSLSNRLHFFGNAFFIPFFLLSIGMLVDVRVLAGDARAWLVMLTMTATVTLTKWLAARAAGLLFGYSRIESGVLFGLTVPQAAATLAAALVGLRVGLLDEAVLNGVILMILATVIIGPLFVERFGRQLALHDEEEYRPEEAPQRILVPLANPSSADVLLDLALLIRDPDSTEPLLPASVVRADEDTAAAEVAAAEKMLSHAVDHLAAAGAPAVPLVRMDENIGKGIARGVAEARSSTIVVGWDGRRFAARGIFGSVLDQLLARTREQVFVARLGHPLNITRRLVVLVPNASDRVSGFRSGVRALKLMAQRLGASIRVIVVGGDAPRYRLHFEAVTPDAPVVADQAAGWQAALALLEREALREDLVVVVSVRAGGISWHPILERLPARLVTLVPQSFIVLYLAEEERRLRGRSVVSALDTAASGE